MSSHSRWQEGHPKNEYKKKKMCQGSGKIVEESKKPVRSHFWGKKKQ